MKYIKLLLTIIVLLVPATPAAYADGMSDFLEGIKAARSGASFDAIMFFSKAIDSNELKGKTLAAAYAQRAVLWNKVNNRDNATEDFGTALKHDPGSEAAKQGLRDLGGF